MSEFGLKVYSASGTERLVGYVPRNVLAIKIIRPWLDGDSSFTFTKSYKGTMSWAIVGHRLSVDQDGGTTQRVVKVTTSGSTVSWSEIDTRYTSGCYPSHSEIVLIAMVER